MPTQRVVQKNAGFTLIEILVSIGIIGVVAGLLSYFIVTQKKTTGRLASNSSCVSVAQSVVDYFKSEGDGLFVNSNGVGPNNRFVNSSPNRDGFDRFSITTGEGVVTSTPFVISQDRVAFPSTHKALNYLNSNNVYTRLLTVAMNTDSCCSDLEDSSCQGAVIFSNQDGAVVNNIQGFNPPTDVVSIRMKTTIAGGVCQAGRHSEYPKSTSAIDAVFEVTFLPGDAKQSFCRGNVTGSFRIDSHPPLVAMNINRESNPKPFEPCPTSATPGAFCLHNVRGQTGGFEYQVRTVADTSECRTCLSRLAPLPNTNPAAGPLICEDTSASQGITICDSVCRGSDAGSIFFCKFAEAGPSFESENWWPCHLPPMGLPASINIRYQNEDLNSLQLSTSAIIEVSSITSNQNYFLDVRALDSFGQTLGPSYKSYAIPAYAEADFPDCACGNNCTWRVTPPSPLSCGVTNLACCDQFPGCPSSNSISCSLLGEVSCIDPTDGNRVISDDYCLPPRPPGIFNATGSINFAHNPAMCPPPPPECEYPGGSAGWVPATVPCGTTITQTRTGSCSVSGACGGPCVQERQSTGPSCVTTTLGGPPPPPVGTCMPSGSWSSCSATQCGVAGTQTRNRSCIGGTCPGPCTIEEQSCVGECVPCTFSSDPEAGWSECSATNCGTIGTQNRSGNCPSGNCMLPCTQQRGCTGPCGRWCYMNKEDHCNGEGGGVPAGPCNPRDDMLIGYGCCSIRPYCHMSRRYECVPFDAPCP